MAFNTSKHGPNNFAVLGDAARIEAVQKGTAYMHVWMYAIGEFENAIDDCEECKLNATVSQAAEEVQCNSSCTDEIPPPLLPGKRFGEVGLTCKNASESFGFPFQKTCDGSANDNFWLNNSYCQQSCANAGFNFANPPCCTSQPPSAPPAPVTICNLHAASTASVHAWDEGVAFYTGSLEGTAYGGNSAGKLLYRLAEKRCANFGTCEVSGAGATGTSQVNTELFAHFANGRDWLQQGKCSSVRPVVDAVVSLMTVPLVQGSLRYAYKVGTTNGVNNIPKDQTPKNAAEGATFSAAVLPLVHYCNTASAAVVSGNLKFGATAFNASTSPLPDFTAVKKAFEDVYACLGITCEQVGGLLDGAGSAYAGAEACTLQSAPIAGYVPGSNVFQHNKIDLDQKAMEDALKAKNFKDNATHSATHWYSVGGNSMSKGNHRAPACAEKVPPRPCRSAWPRPAGMRGLGPGPLPITRPRAHPKRRRSTVPGRPAYACGHCCGLRGVPRYLGCQGCPPRARL